MNRNLPVVLVPEAERDVREAYLWYEGQSPGLGMEFLRCVEAALDSIGRLPLACPVVHGSYRRKLVRRFPHAVYYEAGRGVDRCVVYAVFHFSQDPEKWRVRLP